MSEPLVTLSPKPAASIEPTVSSTPEPLFPELEIGEPIPFPEDLVIFAWSGCTSCDGPHSSLQRFRSESGRVVEATVREAPADGRLMWGWVDENGAVYVADCRESQCPDYLGESSKRPERVARVYRSVDDGDTWMPVERSDELPLVLEEWGNAPQLVPLEDAGDGQFVAHGTAIDLQALDPRGREADGYPAYGVLGAVEVAPDGEIVLRWYARVEEGQSPVIYTTWFRADGTSRWTYSGSGSGVPVGDGLLLGTRAYQAEEIADLYEGPYSAWLPSLIDMESGTIRPIIDPFLSDPHDRNAVVGVRLVD